MSEHRDIANRVLHDYAKATSMFAPRLVRETCPLCRGDIVSKIACSYCRGNGYIIVEAK